MLGKDSVAATMYARHAARSAYRRPGRRRGPAVARYEVQNYSVVARPRGTKVRREVVLIRVLNSLSLGGNKDY